MTQGVTKNFQQRTKIYLEYPFRDKDFFGPLYPCRHITVVSNTSLRTRLEKKVTAIIIHNVTERLDQIQNMTIN